MEQQVEVILRETITEHVNVDQRLQERIRSLVDVALDEAEHMLKFGLADQKMMIMRTLLAASTRTIGKDFATTENEARVALDSLLSSMRVLPEQSDHAADIKALAPRTDDPD